MTPHRIVTAPRLDPVRGHRPVQRGRRPSHRIVTAPRLAEPSGYAHAVVAEPGTLVYLGGQTAQGSDGAIRGSTILEQFDVAAGNVVAALAAAGGRAEHPVLLALYAAA